MPHRYSDSQNDAEALLKAAAIHLLILFCGDTEEGLNFLKDNLEIILRNYDRSLEIYLLQKYDDDPRNQTVYKIRFIKTSVDILVVAGPPQNKSFQRAAAKNEK